MKFEKLMIGIGLMISMNTWAGGEVGNGGVSIVCRDSSGEITQAQLLDIFEGQKLYMLQYSNSGKDVDTRIKTSLKKLKKFPVLQNKITAEIDVIKNRTVFVGNDIELNPTNDA